MTRRYAGFTHVNVSELVKEKSLHSGKHDDEDLDTFVLDEDLVWYLVSPPFSLLLVSSRWRSIISRSSDS